MTIYRLEPFREFLRRAVDLNRLHAPDDPVHAVILAQDALREVGSNPGEPDPATLEGRAAAARRSLVALHREFPAGAPVWEQAAFLLRGFTALHVFPEASFRTGWDCVAGLLEHHGHPVLADLSDVEALRTEAWERIEAAYPQGFRRPDLLRRDDTLAWLSDWFRTRIATAPRTRQA